MIVLDGLQDVSYPELDGKTPYDWGKAGGLLEIEKNCATGKLATTPEGFEPDTQTCILTMLGVNEADIPAGRSCIEALALGVPVGENDIVLRCNFVKISPDGILEDPTCMAPNDVAKRLMDAAQSNQGHRLTQVGSYKCLQVIEGGGEYMRGMKTFPPHNYAGKPLESLLPEGNELAEFLAGITRKQLELNRPYTVLNWAQSVPCSLPAFSSLHGGMTGGLVSATLAPMGCAIAMGMECPAIPTATGDTDTDLAAKVEAALTLAKSCDFVMLHVGGTDEATHRKDAREKAEFVKRIDDELITPILNKCAEGDRIMLTCDHVAICTTGGHTTEPVGFMLYEKGAKLCGDASELDGKKSIEILRDFGK